jgi:hypothetical protein
LSREPYNVSAVFTENKNLIEPASGSFTNSWASPVNSNWSILDEALGGVTTINVTGVTGPLIALSIAQYQPPNIVFTGTQSANLEYVIPSGVGGLWSIFNSTSGAFTIIIGNGGGGPSVTVAQGARAFVVSDGTNVEFADTQPAASALAAAETFATTAANTAQTNAETFATTAANAAQAAAISTAANASNLSSGTVPNARLPNPGIGPGVTIASDPGTTPSGAPGSIFYFF